MSGHDLVVVGDERVEQADHRAGERLVDGADAVAHDADEVALVDGAEVARRRRTARVISPATTADRRVGHRRPRSRRRRRRGRTRARAAKPSAIPRVGTTRTDFDGELVDLLGHGDDVLVVRQDHDLVGVDVASTASSSCAVDGFIDWPPATTACTPSEWKMRRMPSPVATATTAVVTAGPRGRRRLGLAHPPLLLDLLEEVGDADLRAATGVDAASIAAPMSSVWMWQFQMPSPPTTTIESPMPAHTSLKAGIVSSVASRKYMTS